MSSLPITTAVNVTVSKQTAAKSLEDFGLCCIFTENAALPVGEVREYNDVDSFNSDFPGPDSLHECGNIFFEQTPIPTKLLVARVDTATSNYPDTIATVKENHYFYAVALDNNDLALATLQSIVQKVQELELLMIVSRDSSDVVSVASSLQAQNSTRVALIEVDDATQESDRPDLAWLGVGLTQQAGAINWAYQTLTGITPTGKTQSDINSYLNAFVNVYVDIGNSNKTLKGWTLGTDTTYLDQIQSMDWLKINIEEAVYNLLTSGKKIPYTDPGVKTIEAAILAVMREAQTLNILDPDYRISTRADSVTTVPVQQRSDRIAPTITAKARLSGAINEININVNVEI